MIPGKFIVTQSLSYTDSLLCNGVPCFPPGSNSHKMVHSPIERAEYALQWKEKTHDRWDDFLAINAAGNDANKPSAGVYPGLGKAAYGYYPNIVGTQDEFFSFVDDIDLWNPLVDPNNFPPITASTQEVLELQSDVIDAGFANVGAADNVLIVGSVNPEKDGEVDVNASFDSMVESDFSDSDPDVKAVGEHVTTVTGFDKSGTSLAAPQVAGLASLMWLLSPDLRSQPSRTTRQAIIANTRDGTNTTDIIDAYATVLSLDAAALPTAANAKVRKAILDVNNDGFFTSSDISELLSKFVDDFGDPRNPTERDWSRWDLNGDGFTGGSEKKDMFDLNRAGSAQFGATFYTTVSQTIQGSSVSFDENNVTDLQILCYYAYSLVFSGNPDTRDNVIGSACGESAAAEFAVTIEPFFGNSLSPTVAMATDVGSDRFCSANQVSFLGGTFSNLQSVPGSPFLFCATSPFNYYSRIGGNTETILGTAVSGSASLSAVANDNNISWTLSSSGTQVTWSVSATAGDGRGLSQQGILKNFFGAVAFSLSGTINQPGELTAEINPNWASDNGSHPFVTVRGGFNLQHCFGDCLPTQRPRESTRTITSSMIPATLGGTTYVELQAREVRVFGRPRTSFAPGAGAGPLFTITFTPSPSP